MIPKNWLGLRKIIWLLGIRDARWCHWISTPSPQAAVAFTA